MPSFTRRGPIIFTVNTLASQIHTCDTRHPPPSRPRARATQILLHIQSTVQLPSRACAECSSYGRLAWKSKRTQHGANIIAVARKNLAHFHGIYHQMTAGMRLQMRSQHWMGHWQPCRWNLIPDHAEMSSILTNLQTVGPVRLGTNLNPQAWMSVQRRGTC
jgi:hypothetical protein